MSRDLIDFKRGWRREDAAALYDGKYRLQFQYGSRTGMVPDDIACFADDDEAGARAAAETLERDFPGMVVRIVRYGKFLDLKGER